MFRRILRPASNYFKKPYAVPATTTVAALLATTCYCYYHFQQQQQQEQLLISNNYNNYLPTVYAQEKSESDVVEQTAPVYRIVITGGPCAGKSSGMTLLSERLKALGFEVFIITEIATMVFTGGAHIYEGMDISERFALESGIMKMQMTLEDVYNNIAKASGKPTVLLCDRGVLDTRAYMDPTAYDSMMEANGWNVGKLRDARYDCVIHMVTAAFGAEQFYTLANNQTRTESVELAREVDLKLRESYVGHPNLYIIDNSTGFEEKMERVMDTVSRVIGLPQPIGTKRKYLVNGSVSNNTLLQNQVSFVETEIEQAFLMDATSNEQPQIRKQRSKDGSITYQWSKKVFSDDGKMALQLRRISGRTHLTLMNQQKKDFKPIKKYVRSFVYKNHYFELVTYLLHSVSYSDNRNVTILRVEARPEQQVALPPFLQDFISADVTYNNKYSSFQLASSGGQKPKE